MPILPQPSIPPSEPAALRYLGRGRNDQATRVQLSVALIAGLIMVAVPLYLWRRPPPEVEIGRSGLVDLPATAPQPRALSPLAAPLGMTMGALSAAPVSPAAPGSPGSAAGPRGVSVTDAKVLRCHKPGSSRVAAERCDRQPLFEEALAKAVRDNAPCAPVTAAGGSVNFVLDVDYRAKKARVWAGRSGTMRQKAKDVVACVNRSLPSPDWAQVPHQYEKYQVALMATYPPAPQGVVAGALPDERGARLRVAEAGVDRTSAAPAYASPRPGSIGRARRPLTRRRGPSSGGAFRQASGVLARAARRTRG
ncbi:MAG: hypothetical protein MUF34_26450 [Polyangiaceae bacterium]|nr:hypothetical protein [Polyangiaceae bacterium]